MAQPLTGQELKNRFLSSESLINENRVQVPEALKMKLYGLGKQIKEGDCKMPQPPASNAVLRAKWEAWTQCAGLSIERSMQEYIAIVETLEPSARSSSLPPAPLLSSVSTKNPPLEAAPVSMSKKGILFKQRDLFKGWRPRYFVLQDNFLHYYLEQDDPSPRNTLDLTGCSITTTKSVNVDGIEYYPFVITHPKSKTPYNLSSDSKLDADTWVAKLIEAANIPTSSPVIISTSESESRRPRIDSINETHQPYFDQNVAHGPETRMYIPPEHLPRVEKSAQSLVEKLTSSDSNGWEIFLQKEGLVAKKKAGAIMSVKAEIIIPYNIYDVFATLMDPKRQTVLDSQRLQQDKLKEFSNHTWVDYIRFKGVWPTSPRDFVNIAHWRLLKDGRVVVVAYSEKFDDLKPPEEGHVRAETILGGYLLVPIPEGTKVMYLVETDLKGSLPASVVNLAANSQPMLLMTLRKVMDADKKAGGNNRLLSAPPDYADLVSLIANVSYEARPSIAGGDVPKNIAATAAAASAPTPAASGSSSSSANSIPIQRKASLLKIASKSPRLNTVAMLMLFFPPLLYFVVGGKWRSVAFLAGLVVTARYLFHKHLGKAINKLPSTQMQRQTPGGKIVYRFPVDLGPLLLAINEKRTEFELEMSITHMVVKACAMTINEFSTLNGHLVMDNFYRANSSANSGSSTAAAGVDISVSVNVNDVQSVAVKIVDADSKPVEYIANELIEAGKAIRVGSDNDSTNSKVMEKLSKALPPSVLSLLKKFLYDLSAQYGISIPVLGVNAFPLGACTVISAGTDGDTDLDMAVIADTTEASAPITVTLGGIRIAPALEQDRRVTGSPVLNVAVSIDSRAATAGEGKRFCKRLQEFINDPSTLEAVHKKYIFGKEEAAKRKQFFGKQ